MGIPVRRRRYSLTLLLAVFGCNFMDRQLLGVLMPAIKAEFTASDTLLGFLAGPAFALFYTTLGIPLAVVADRASRAWLITACLAVFSAMTALSGLVVGFWQLFLARVGVGIGEAGTNPASHSLIADLYGPRERSSAMAVFALGPQLGLVLAFLLGGWIGQRWGWRAAFLVAGVAGLVLSLVVAVSLGEPERRQEAVGAGSDSGGPLAAIRRLWAVPALRHLFVGASLASALGYSALTWTPSFLVRSHGFDTAGAGAILALVLGAVGGAGTFLGGYLADALGARNPRWPFWIVAVALAVSTPFWVATYLVSRPGAAVGLMVLPGFLAAVFLGPTFALVQALVEPSHRAVSAAVLLFLANLVGYGLGPLAVGVLSDALAPRAGPDSLRYALAAASVLGAWAALHYLVAGRALPAGRTERGLLDA